MVGDFGLSKPEPSEHAAHESVSLRHRPKCFKHPAVDQTEIADLGWNID